MVQHKALKEEDLQKYRNAAYLKEKNIHLNDITNEKTNADIREDVKHNSDSEVDDEYWEAEEGGVLRIALAHDVASAGAVALELPRVTGP